MYTIDFNKSSEIVARKVELTLASSEQQKKRRTSATGSGGAGLGHPSALSHSVSTPQLQGAWNLRNLENAVPPMDNARTRGEDGRWGGKDFEE